MARQKGIRGLLRTSFLERNQRVIGVISVTAILVGTAVALLLSGGVLARTYPVTAHFTDAAGIASGDMVTVAGLDAGTVKGVRVEGGGVVMDLAVNQGVDLPADTRANIRVLTLLGRRTVDLVTGQDRKHTLEQAGVIPVDRTFTPIDITQLGDVSVRLATQSDVQALNELLREAAMITEGKRADVTQLVAGLADLTEAVDQRRHQLGDLITSFRKISGTLAERDDTIVSLIDNLDPVLSNLADHQQDLARLLVATDSASHEAASLLTRNRSVLDSTLDSLHTDLQVLSRHQLDLAGALASVQESVQGYASVGYSGGTCGYQNPPCERGSPNEWANIFVQSLGPLGVDALLGECGAVDQLIDLALGTDCSDSPNGGGGGASAQQDKPGSSQDSGQPKLEPPLPGDVGDLVDSVLGKGGL